MSATAPQPSTPEEQIDPSHSFEGIQEAELTTELEEQTGQDADQDNSDAGSTTSWVSTNAGDKESLKTNSHNIVQLVTSLFKAKPENIQLEHLPGGGYNRVVALNITPPQPAKWTLRWFFQLVASVFGWKVQQEPEKYVIRIPRSEGPSPTYGMDWDVTVLKFAQAKLQVAVPEVLHYEKTSDNILGSQYMIQRRIPGHCMDGDPAKGEALEYRKLNAPQAKSATRQITAILQNLQKVTSRTPGVIHPSNEPATFFRSSGDGLALQNFEVTYEHTHALSTPQTTYDFIANLCDRLWEPRKENDKTGFYFIWMQLKKVAGHMHRRGFLPNTDEFHFYHCDFYPRNIIASITSNDNVRINGVVDWDAEYAAFVPKFLAYQAPWWLWINDSDFDNKDGENWLDSTICRNWGWHPEDERRALAEPITEKGREVKKLWEELAGEEWLRYAYAPEYLIARRMYRIFFSGLNDNEHYKDAKYCLEAWNELYPEDDLSDLFDDPNSGYIPDPDPPFCGTKYGTCVYEPDTYTDLSSFPTCIRDPTPQMWIVDQYCRFRGGMKAAGFFGGPDSDSDDEEEEFEEFLVYYDENYADLDTFPTCVRDFGDDTWINAQRRRFMADIDALNKEDSSDDGSETSSSSSEN